MTETGLTAVSLFAGIGGIDLALERSGVRVVAAVEIDKECRGVIRRHFPQVTLFEDVREVTGEQLRAAGFVPGRGVLAGGWPCQGNSVAGRRGGMGDARSGLWRHVVRLLAETHPRWFLGENVPGLLSVNGGADVAVVRSDLARLGYWWAERILDAQHFGVPQRRRRVFFVGCLGERAAPVQVLLEPEGSTGDLAARGQARSATAAGAARGAGVASVATLQGGGRRGHRIDAEGAAGGHLTVVTHTLTSRSAAEEDGTGRGVPVIAHALTSEGADASEDGTGRGTPLVTVAAPLTSGSATGEGVNRPGRRQEDDVNLVSLAVAGDFSASDDIAQTIRSANGQPGCVSDALAVRRLSPLECERLQGFPDNWTRFLADGTGQSDSARYRQCGNAVAVPCVEWIAQRLVSADAALPVADRCEAAS
jgi:DNA (cytosine-5)-methyltransferase 1